MVRTDVDPDARGIHVDTGSNVDADPWSRHVDAWIDRVRWGCHADACIDGVHWDRVAICSMNAMHGDILPPASRLGC